MTGNESNGGNPFYRLKLDLNAFSKLAGKAGLFPRLMNEEDISVVYNEQLSCQNGYEAFRAKNGNPGLSFEELKRALVLVTIKVANKYNEDEENPIDQVSLPEENESFHHPITPSNIGGESASKFWNDANNSKDKYN